MSDEMIAEMEKLEYQGFVADSHARLPLATQIALAALNGLMLVNGGAIVALFTFIGSSTASFAKVPIWWSFGLFAAGLALTLFANILGYVAQGSYMEASSAKAGNLNRRLRKLPEDLNEKRADDRGQRADSLAVTAASLALLLFVAGSAAALYGVMEGEQCPAKITKAQLPAK